MKRLIYIAYPIDNAMLSEKQIGQINVAKASLLAHDQTPAAAVYDPGDAFLVRKGSEPGTELSAVNNAAIDVADGVLAFLPLGVSSIGVPMEIAQAGLAGKPVAVVSDSYSWAIRIDRLNVRIFAEGDVEAAIEWLLGFVQPELGIAIDPLPVVYSSGQAWLPTRTHPDDAGLDLYVAKDTWLPWGDFVDVPCGVKVELPSWSWGLLVGRSSTFRRRKIEVQTGIIDAGYRGELFAACIWRPNDSGVYVKGDQTLVKKGERLAQLIVVPNGTRDVEPILVAELSEHARGENGFGSSGA